MEQNFYSVAFLYKAAVRGTSGPGFHISWQVDERKESDRLSRAIAKVTEVLDKVKIDNRMEYCFPDGSLFLYLRTEYDIINLSYILRAHLNGMEFQIVPLSPLDKAHYGDEETLEQFFNRVLSEKAHRKKSLINFVATAVMP